MSDERLIADNKGFTLESAQASARAGKIENWVHDYLSTGYWSNDGLSKGLKLCRRWWAGPLRLRTKDLARKVGPKPGLEYQVPPKDWADKVGRMAKRMVDTESIPPLIAEFVEGDLVVCDGNTRLGAMELLKWEYCWVIVWFNSEADCNSHMSMHSSPGSS